MSIQEFIRLVRLKSGLNQENFAKKCGIGRMTISALECGKIRNGNRIPRLSTLYKIFNIAHELGFKEELMDFKEIKEIFND